MAKDPAVLFYTSDFLTGTMLMSDEEVGQYIKLLCLQHQRGRLTENHMLTICKAKDNEVFNKFIKDDNGLYYNERMEDEAIKRKNFTESRKHNGSKGGRPKKSKPNAKPSGKPNAKPKQNLTENENENENIDIIEFNTFWNNYHEVTNQSKTDKDPTIKYWNRLTEKEKQKAIDKIQIYYDNIKDYGKGKMPKKARTYLSDKNFNDEYDISHSSSKPNSLPLGVRLPKPKPIPKDLYDN